MAGRIGLLAPVAVLLLLTGCSRPAPPAPASPAPQAEAAPAPTTSRTQPEDSAPVPGYLFPRDDLSMTFQVADWGAPQPETVPEYLVALDGYRVAVANGKAYAEWSFTRMEGLWRLDPGGSGVMLRYLPPWLEDGATWRQEAGDATVWFTLRRQNVRCENGAYEVTATADECWILTVLGRENRTVFYLTPGYGPVFVRSEHFTRPPLSFTKTLTAAAVVSLQSDQRDALLRESPGGSRRYAEVAAVPAAEFVLAEERLVEAPSRQAIEDLLKQLREGRFADLAAGTDGGLRIVYYWPKGFEVLPVTGETLTRSLEAMFKGASVKLEGFRPQAYPGAQVEVVLSGLNQVEVPSSLDRPVKINGLVNVRLVPGKDGTWRLVSIAADDGYLRQSLGSYKAYN